MSQSPAERASIDDKHPYAQASLQLNRLVRLGRPFSGNERNCCYLNTGENRFANVAGISGADFDDDGRAIAACDWDFDGDLDFWLSNRTGPQLRFLRNDLASENHFIAIRLKGTTSNRDAIGARIRLTVETSTSEPMLLDRTVRAGEGYLSQGTKWLHFGLGDSDAIERVQVRWPGQPWISLDSVPAVDQFYELQQDDSKLSRFRAPESRIAPTIAAPNQPPRGSSATVLARSLPMPRLRYRERATPNTTEAASRAESESSDLSDATETGGQPVLVTLWASWCANCVAELHEWNERATEFRNEGLSIVAISMDGVTDAEHDSLPVEAFLKTTQLPMTRGEGSERLVELLQLVNDMLIFRDDHRALPLPISLLLDADGNLAAVYKGRTSAEQILHDVRLVEKTSPKQKLMASVPFPGTWLAPPGDYSYDRFVGRLWEDGLSEEALAYASRLERFAAKPALAAVNWRNALGLLSQQRTAKAVKLLERVVVIDANHAESLSQLGAIAGQQGKLKVSIDYLRRAVAAAPNSTTARVNLAIAHRKNGNLSEARKQAEEAIELDNDLVSAHQTLGQIAARQMDFEVAAAAFSRASKLVPEDDEHTFNHVTAIVELGDFAKALTLLESLSGREATRTRALRYRAEIYQRQGRAEAALKCYRELMTIDSNSLDLRFRAAQLQESLLDWQGALDSYRELFSKAKGDPIIESRIAWILASIPDKTLRDGSEALRLAQSAAKKTNNQNPLILDALAAALAEVGKFDQAARTADIAISIANRDRRQGFAAELEQRRELYKSKNKFRLAIKPKQ